MIDGHSFVVSEDEPMPRDHKLIHHRLTPPHFDAQMNACLSPHWEERIHVFVILLINQSFGSMASPTFINGSILLGKSIIGQNVTKGSLVFPRE